MVFPILLLFMICKVGQTYIQTIHGRNSITCLTNSDHSVYIYPPIVQSKNVENYLGDAIWENDDWEFVNASKLNLQTIEDDRIQDSQNVFTKLVKFDPVRCISFTIFGATELTIFVNDGGRRNKRVSFKTEKSQKFNRYTILTTGQTYVFENNRLVETISDINVSNLTEIVAKTDDYVYWQISNYSIRTARLVSKEKSVVRIPPTGRKYLVLSTSLCKSCFLEITSSIQENVITVNSSSQTGLLKSWSKVTIPIKPDKEVTLYISRKKHDSKADYGFWTLDLRLGPKIQKKLAIYTYPFYEDSKDHRCEILEPSGGTENEKNIQGGQKWELCHEAGKLGPDCETDCKDLLGVEFEFCQNHTICVGDVCTCGWGSSGTFCEESCSNGFWGKNCKNKCPSECPDCDPVTGNSSDSCKVLKSGRNGWNANIWLGILLGLALIIIIPFIVVVVIKCEKRKIKKKVEVEQTMQSRTHLWSSTSQLQIMY